MVNQEIVNIARTYAELLRETLDNVDSVYLFGSLVSRANSDSDIDIAVISKNFIDNLNATRLQLKRIRREVDPRIEPHPFHTKDFNMENPFAKNIIETGIRII